MAYIPTKAERARVHRWVERWRKTLHLQAYNIRVTFGKKANKDNPNSAATTSVWTPYLDVTITFWPLFWEESIQDQERICIHELTHVYTQPMKDLLYAVLNGKMVTWAQANDANETLTDHLTNVLWLNL